MTTFTVMAASQAHRWLLVHPRMAQLPDGRYHCPDCDALSIDPEALIRLRCRTPPAITDPVFSMLEDTPRRPRLGDTWEHPDLGILYAVRSGRGDHWWHNDRKMLVLLEPIRIEGENPHVLDVVGTNKRVFIPSTKDFEEQAVESWSRELARDADHFMEKKGYIPLSPHEHHFPFDERTDAVMEIRTKFKARTMTLHMGGGA